MVIKKFEAETETAAIVLAKEELGKDAIVMNVKKIKPRGLYRFFKKPTVEVTAAVDDTASYGSGEKMLSELQKLQQEKEREYEKEKESAEKMRLSSLKDNPNIIIEEEREKKETEETAIEQKLNELQSLLKQQLQGKEENQEEESKQEEKESKIDIYTKLIIEQMTNNEVDEKYALQIIEEIQNGLNEESSVDNVLSSVYQKIILKIGQIKTISLEEGSPRYIFFVGSTGVGKTTTIAKIASDLKLKKKANIALITADTYRIAAVEQLRTYANILNIPIKVIYTAEELASAREELQEYDLVLVDTAGRSHQSKEQREDLKELISAVPAEERDAYLVLSATTKYHDLIKITESYREIINYNLIFTKLDETDCIGNILNIHMLTGAALSYTTYGQNVPDDIERINAQSIAKKLLGGRH